MLRLNLTLIMALATAAEVLPQGNPLVGQPFADLSALNWVSDRPAPSGPRPLTLFRWWTTNCPHCTASLPALSELIKSKGDGVRLVAVFHPKSPERRTDKDLAAYLRTHGVDAALARDPQWTVLKSLMKRAGLTRFTSVSFLVDAAGRVAWVHRGPRVHPDAEGRHGSAQQDFRDLDDTLRRLLDRRPDDLRVMSFNIRFAAGPDGDNRWDRRRDLLLRTIRRFDPDLRGTHEVLPGQPRWLEQHLPDYEAVGRGRRKLGLGEQCTVFVRKSRARVLTDETFWLSPTPDEPGSRGWDAALPRIATSVKLKDLRTDKVLQLINTHFDHRGAEARRRSATLLSSHVQRLPETLPVLVMGDFNAAEASAPYNALVGGPRGLMDTLRRHRPEDTLGGTIHGFTGRPRRGRIDWVLASDGFQVRSAAVDRYCVDGRYPSDHFPVTAVLSTR